MEEFGDNKFNFDENGRKFSRWVKNTPRRGSNFSFSHRVFKRHVLQAHKNQGLFGKGITITQNMKFVCHWVENKKLGDDDFKFDENGRKFSKEVENMVGKRRKMLKKKIFTQNMICLS